MLLPLKVDVPTSRIPWMNYLLIISTIIVSGMAFADETFLLKLAGIVESDSGVDTFGLSDSWATRAVAAFTSIFLHGDLFHLLGNMWFLWVFGNAINYKFGQLQYLGMFLLAGWVGSMLHFGFVESPVIGASGAINGVVGAFLVFFPRNEVKMVWIWGVFGRTFSLSSYWVILYWLLWDIGSLVLDAGGGVAFWAHVGGFASGFGIGMACAALGYVQPNEDEQTLLQVFASPKNSNSRYY